MAEKPAPKYKLRRPKIGLALGSGVARGWAHIGILKAMKARGIIPDVVAGTSVGAVVGAAYVTGSLERLEDWTRNLSKINFFRFLDFRLRGAGLFGGKKLHDLMVKSFGNQNIEDLKTPFTAIACELMSGHEIWLRDGPLIDAVQASFALPGVFEPFCHEGRWLVDGALVNPVPVSACRAMGAELVIAVNLVEDMYGRARAEREGLVGTGKYGVFTEFMKPQTLTSNPLSQTFIRKLLTHKNDSPSIFANMAASLNIIQNRLARSRLAGDPPDILIAPRAGHIGLMEFHRGAELIEIGEKAFEDEYDSLLDALTIIGYRINRARARDQKRKKT
ncbi:MAG: patatin-like phospholipase family protein [Proteobacteria bacterium]|nr:patatin-like phospholipase family protein [Pseudomonadota bacterium]